ncbi:hypothetical protein U9M48_041676 [Paspalum notatum var. saurae]|uniref:Uncharacterized protein n=1 Tax=Paspalum notatum var. saurae TaxID=547442 RepID=A0AAQ3UV25_PASNO
MAPGLPLSWEGGCLDLCLRGTEAASKQVGARAATFMPANCSMEYHDDTSTAPPSGPSTQGRKGRCYQNPEKK